jgi:DNA-binding XRE family transcriptional regulator
MRDKKINDISLIRLIDKEGKTQAEAAGVFGVTRQAINQRLRELRGETSKVVTAKQKLNAAVHYKLDAMQQLEKINGYANELLDLLMRWNRGEDEALQALESQMKTVLVGKKKILVTEVKFKDPRQLALACMSEIRGQLKLQLEIFQALFDMNAAKEFMDEVLNAISEVSPDVRDRIVSNLNKKRAIRSAVKFN